MKHALTVQRCVILAFLLVQFTDALRVLVTGATGKLGRLVVKELSKKADTQVIACVRDETKAKEIFDGHKAVTIKEFDLDRTNDIEEQLCEGVDHVIWCAAGGVQVRAQEGPLNKLLDMFKGKREVIDISAVREMDIEQCFPRYATDSTGYCGAKLRICHNLRSILCIWACPARFPRGQTQAC